AKPRQSKKRKWSFRRLLKTSNVKLDHKLKNRQFKKESTDKKHRKEQKKLRAAIKDVALKDEEEEEFVESLPIDMMDEDDLEPWLRKPPSSPETCHRGNDTVMRRCPERCKKIRAEEENAQRGGVSLQSYKGLTEVAIRCICELLVALPYFNFHNNIIVMVVPLMNDPIKRVSDMCCEAVKKLLKQDKQGQASLGTVKVISGLVKSRNYDVRPELLKILLCLRIKEVEVKKGTDDTAPKKKLMDYKDKKKNLSRMQRSVAQAPVCLFAPLINMEFFDDLLNFLHLIQSGDLTYRESLHCIQTAFNILSGQGDVLNIDPLEFYTHLYKTLLKLNAGASNDDISIVLRCLDVMLTKRRKRRLSTLSLHTLPNATVGILASNKMLIHTFPKCNILLDNEAQGSGVFLPELDEPEYCNPQNTKHYHPVVRFATHLCAGAPSEEDTLLLTRLRHPVELFEDYRAKDMTFNPPVAAPSTKKEVHPFPPCPSLTWPRISTLSITAFLSADSIALVSQINASPGLPTTSQIRGQCVKSEGLLSGPLALYGGATGFNSWADSFLCIHQ
uniref:NOC3-like DNA replication regulator n=1 Tax=Oncorhynchus tshawytscha TaxID=74940 RepID=A0AAZ3RK41_ONCTS